MFQGDNMTKDEHKALLLDRGFRVCSTSYRAKLPSDDGIFQSILSSALGSAERHRSFCTVQALQLLNTEYAQALSYLESTRAKHLHAAGVRFVVGKTQL